MNSSLRTINGKRLVISAIAVPSSYAVLFHVSSNAQEERNKPEIAREGPRSRRTGIQRRHPARQLQRSTPKEKSTIYAGYGRPKGIDSWTNTSRPLAPPCHGGHRLFCRVPQCGPRSGGHRHGHAGWPGSPFMPATVISAWRRLRASYGSPRFDTKAKYLFLFQVIASRGLSAKSNDRRQVEKISNAIKAISAKKRTTRSRMPRAKTRPSS